MTRIIAGSLGGRRLTTPTGDRTRPTSDRVREALFGALTAARDLHEARVLDLYAGTGALGIEACSRGAAFAMFVESHGKTAALLRRNLAGLGLSGNTRVVAAPLPSAVEKPAEAPFDVIFADPPYGVANAELERLLAGLVEHGWIDIDADVIIERSGRSPAPPWPKQLAEVRSRRYGESTLWYGRPSWT